MHSLLFFSYVIGAMFVRSAVQVAKFLFKSCFIMSWEWKYDVTSLWKLLQHS